ncbi:polymer-forming cytoskeletal protein [uncultured Novosphingobium sp.]|uniref:bactofilin family protein n=1 Tax=Novosphingobium fluoreni TaxID=1391222 RepID=UPI0007366216|nr:polymer-forming cytoskeletal protein [uncultured Novosphingobium sp.]KTR82758.1 cell shape determination protein CcmA [Novosphingobium barchaimii]
MSKPIGSHRPLHGSTTSILGGDTAISGNISATADLHVEGRVEGDITCTALIQGEGSEVIGAIMAESARIAGRIDGSVTAREVVIMKSARIRGDIIYDALTIEQGAQLDGRLTPRSGQAQPVSRPAAVVEQPSELARLVLASPTVEAEG